MEKLNKELQQFLKESNLPEEHKLTIRFLLESIEKNQMSEFVSKTFLFHGDPGIGKTYFVDHMIKQLGLPVIFMGPFQFEHNESIQCKNLKELFEKLKKTKEAVVFIDDLQNTFKMEYNGFGDMSVTDSERKLFLSLLEHIKRTNERKFLFITLNDEDTLEESWLDRIETRIELDIPKEKSKKLFLLDKYPKFLKKSMIKEIAEKSIGYNFRNLDELIKIAYREGNGVINRRSIKNAFSVYSPTSMARYDVTNKINLRFKDVVGNEKLKKELSFLKQYIKHPRLFDKNGIQRSNVMVFSGPPGTGKTYMAKALAGELDVPMINVDARNLLGRSGPLFGVSKIVSLARRFKNCIVFVDEFDKLIGQQMLAEEEGVIGNFEAEIDGIREKTKAIMILTMNNKSRFGSAFHDRIPCFDFGFPSEEDRRSFITNKVSKSGIAFSNEHIDFLVRTTENESYRQIEKIWNNILFKMMDNSEVRVKNNKLIANEKHVEQAINDTVESVKRRNNPSMFG